MTMADTIAVMHDGRIEQLGTPTELYEQPATEFVANFLGQSNLLQGQVAERESDHVVLVVGDGRVRVPAHMLRGSNGTAQVGVRPEKIRLLPAEAAEAPWQCEIEGTIIDRSYTGVSTQFLVRTSWGQELAVSIQNLSSTEDLQPGTKVRMVWEPHHTFVVAANGSGS